MGSMAGQDWAPMSWIFAVGCTTGVALAGSLLLEEVAREEVEAVVEGVATCTVDTGTLKARAMSGFCWTGEVAVCAWFCFSRFRHFALRFWNQTYKQSHETYH